MINKKFCRMKTSIHQSVSGRNYLRLAIGLSCIILVLTPCRMAALLRADEQPALAPVSIRLVPPVTTLWGYRATQRFLVLAHDADGLEKDVTSQSHFTVSNSQVVESAPGGKIIAVSDGVATVTAKLGSLSATAHLQSKESDRQPSLSFDGAITQILTKRGCNGSKCHGGVKGRGDFKLSLDGIIPQEDYEWITLGGGYQVLTDEPLEPRIPRVNLQNPEQSLLLQKPTDADAHEGGVQLPQESSDYETILRWIQSGAPFRVADEDSSHIELLEVTPADVVLKQSENHQLIVTAHFQNGRQQDMTDQVRYDSLDPEIATVGPDGEVRAGRVGEVAIMIRAAGRSTAARVAVITRTIADYPQVPRNNFVDDEIFDKLRRFHIIPSSLCNDAEFLRRACLDITGTLPPPERVAEFITSPDPNKREKLVQILLNSPEYNEYWTFRLADLFLVKSGYNYWEWVRQSVASNKPYNTIAIERIAAQGVAGAADHFKGPEDDVERVVAEQFRVFFGRRMDCAQCHNHPYDRWTQNQFWGLASFFGKTNKMGTIQGGVTYDDPRGREEEFGEMGRTALTFKLVTHLRTKQVVEPMFPGGHVLPEAARSDPRMALARWMTSQQEFSEATVNRFWGFFFGRGLVDPVDDFRSENPPTHPVLLKKLADDFQEHGYDLKHLIERIVLSRAYQLSSATNPTNLNDELNYSHAWSRPLDAEVLLDALASATGVAPDFSPPDGIYAYQTPLPGVRAINLKFPAQYNSRFLEIYGLPQRNAVAERESSASLGQALHMLVGPTYNQRLSQPDSRLGQLLAQDVADTDIIEQLYLASLSRFPSNTERENLITLIQSQPVRQNALEDLLWALLNSREFAENH
ncbi:MAG: hypothetical protein CMJ81_11155 [Planctomycetaceae bacterium]|nr:hypothetical protein [Planctomycetaceae bacterium]